MIATFITSFLLLIVTAFVIYRWQRTSANQNDELALPSRRYGGLFSDDELLDTPSLLAGSDIEAQKLEQREAENKRIQLEKTKSQADNQKDLMAATVGVEIASKRSEQRKAEAEGEAHYILATGKAEAEKVRLMGEAQGVAYKEQVNALGPQGVALVETLKVIGEKGVRITPDVMASGGAGDGAGGIGTLLLLNLFRDRLNLPAENGSKAPVR